MLTREGRHGRPPHDGSAPYGRFTSWRECRACLFIANGDYVIGRRSLRCFVGFFGITRGLPRVIDSIERNIFAPLDLGGISTTCAAHLNKPHVLDAPRSGEAGINFVQDDLGRLRLDKVLVERQSDVNIAPFLHCALRVPLIFEPDPDGKVRRNVVQQLYSLQRLGMMYEEYGPKNFDFAVILRPDLRYLNAMPLREILAQLGVNGAHTWRRRLKPAASLITPAWHEWGGLNDRFAFATSAGARTYMNRLDHLPEYCRIRPAFQGEALLKFAVEQDGIRSARTWMRAERVRSDGSVAWRDKLGRKERLRLATQKMFNRLLYW